MTKKKAWDWCSKYVRLRDALAFCERREIDLVQFHRVEDLPVACCTCGAIRTFRQVDAGHYFGRGLGGGSGAYFDERNLNTQCKTCNGFHQGNFDSYTAFMQTKYGQEVIDELHILHIGGRSYRNGEIEAIALMYKGMFEELKAKVG